MVGEGVVGDIPKGEGGSLFGQGSCEMARCVNNEGDTEVCLVCI